MNTYRETIGEIKRLDAEMLAYHAVMNSIERATNKDATWENYLPFQNLPIGQELIKWQKIVGAEREALEASLPDAVRGYYELQIGK